MKMKATEELMTRFYQHLGELFYAVAMVDGVVRKEEEDALKKIITQEWKDLEHSEDEFHSDAAFQIEAVFDFLNETEANSEEWFDDFKAFHKTHEHLFTPQVNKLIMRTADEIASSFHNKNKSELTILTRLNFILSGAVL
nr:hypothetical protein [uncultured bacterium]